MKGKNAAPAGEVVSKTVCCARLGWTRYQFDENARKGMPYVSAPESKGGEWRVDLAAVEAWVEAERERSREYVRRQEERSRREYAEAEARLAKWAKFLGH